MNETPPSENHLKRDPLPGRRILLAGFLILWTASIGLALVLKTLLTPENFPVGSDPSFEITLAVFCFLAGAMGIIFIIHGLMEEEGRFGGKLRQHLRTATIGTSILMGIVLIIGVLLFSANNAVAAQFKPWVISQPRPDYSFPDFPTPALAQPIPTYDPKGKYFAGGINASMDNLRVGDMQVSVSPSDGTIRSFEISLNRINCSVQSGGSVTTYAVNDSKQLIMGPVQVQSDGSFFAGNENASLHGVVVSDTEMRGTLYLRYTNPANQQTCDLGNFEWDAKSTK